MDLIGEEKLEGFVLRTLSVVEGKVRTPSAHSQAHIPPPVQSGSESIKLVHLNYSPPLRLPLMFLDIDHRLNHNYVNNSHLLVKRLDPVFLEKYSPQKL